MMIKIKLILLFSLFITIDLSAQLPFPFEPLQKENYYHAYLTLSQTQEQYVGHKFENQFWQAYGTLSAFMGQYKKADKCYYLRDSIFNRLADSIVQIDVSKYGITQLDLSKLYQNNNVLLLNEEHNQSKNRAFLYSQLSFLKEKGYKYLAIEALNNEDYLDKELETRAYPIYNKTGVYINDPIFAHVIRKALRLGFKLIPYDSYSENREEEQAVNIVNAYHPKKGKLVVFAGYSHICEDCDKELMGSFLKDKLGQDVLSISQYIPKEYRYYTNDSLPFHLIPAESECFDFYLVQENTTDQLNIPEWYELMDFQLAPLHDFYTKKVELPFLIQVYYFNEQNGIPVFQYLVENKIDQNILLAFPAGGKFNLIITNKNSIDSVQINF